MNKPLKTGILGNGTIAGAHLGGYRRLTADGEVDVDAYCDIRPERLEGLAARTYTDIDAFLEGERGRLDYVDICLPTYLHAGTAIKAMELGYNVLSEKPMALDYESALKMCETAKRTGRTLMIAHCCRFTGMMELIRDYIAKGTFGNVRYAEFYREGGGVKPAGYQNWFRDEKRSGGAMLDLHIHDVDMLLWLFGMPEAVSTAAMNIIPGAGFDSMSTNYVYKDKFARIFCDWTIAHDRFNTRCYRINFEGGYIFCDGSRGRGTAVAVALDGTETDLSEYVKGDMYYNEIKYYAGRVAEGKPVEFCTPEESAAAVAVALAERRSALAGGERVALDGIVIK